MSKIDLDMANLIELVMNSSKFSDMPVRHIKDHLFKLFPKLSPLDFDKTFNYMKKNGIILVSRTIETSHEDIRMYKTFVSTV